MMMGKALVSNLKICGSSMSSGSCCLVKSKLWRMSLTAPSRSAPKSKPSVTTDRLSLDTELRFCTPLTEPNASSIVSVTLASTSAADAPG